MLLRTNRSAREKERSLEAEKQPDPKEQLEPIRIRPEWRRIDFLKTRGRCEKQSQQLRAKKETRDDATNDKRLNSNKHRHRHRHGQVLQMHFNIPMQHRPMRMQKEIY